MWLCSSNGTARDQRLGRLVEFDLDRVGSVDEDVRMRVLLFLGGLSVATVVHSAALPQHPATIVEPAAASTAPSSRDFREPSHEEDWRERGEHGGFRRCWLPLLLLLAVVHLLLTIVVAQDVQQTRASAIWICIALFAGLPGTAVYALFRIGNILSRDKTG